jgi:hypothetical protein
VRWWVRWRPPYDVRARTVDVAAAAVGPASTFELGHGWRCSLLRPDSAGSRAATCRRRDSTVEVIVACRPPDDSASTRLRFTGLDGRELTAFELGCRRTGSAAPPPTR